jgi:FkbM family methyltransferase
MQRGTYEPFATQLFKEVVKNGMVVCDIGAQIGYYTLLAAWNVGQQGQVYAFEPDPRSFSYLIRNIEQNGLSKVVVPVNKAVSNRGGTVMLYLDEIDARGSSLFRHPHVGKRVSVEALILDEFFPKHIGVDVVKIDAEGSELLVLESMERLLGRTKQIKLFVECNPFMLKIAGSSVEELTSKLRSHGFNIKIIDERARKLVEADPNYIYAYANSETKVPAYRGWAVMLYCVRS